MNTEQHEPTDTEMLDWLENHLRRMERDTGIYTLHVDIDDIYVQITSPCENIRVAIKQAMKA